MEMVLTGNMISAQEAEKAGWYIGNDKSGKIPEKPLKFLL